MDTFNPDYYQNDLGFECIDLTEQYSFNAGNCLKYMFRLHGKNTVSENLGKAAWYARRAHRHGERFRPVLPSDSNDADRLLRTLAENDWQHVAPFWDTVAACHAGAADTEDVMNTIDQLIATIDNARNAR